MLALQLRIVVDHFVRRMSAPITNDLTAHPGINEVRNPASPKSVHPRAGLDEFQLPQDRLKFVFQHIRYENLSHSSR
jgi:hypothetical protein